MSLENLPPPGPDNDMKAGQPKGAEGLFLPLQQVQNIARLWVNFRPIIGFGARLAKQKIPKELDDALTMIAGGASPEQLQQMATGNQGPPGQWQPPQNYGEDAVPENEPGTPVMTHTLAEEAYYLHTVKNMGVRQIAQEFTNRGNPVSKATVARYIDDIEQELNDARGAKWRVAVKGLSIIAAWLGSAFGLDLLLKLLHVL